MADPVARDDGPYHVLENETFTLLAPGILANDDWSTTRETSEQHPADSNYDLIYTGVVPGDWS